MNRDDSQSTKTQTMTKPNKLRQLIKSSRRDVIKAAGAVGFLSAAGMSGTAAAKGNNYGNGNGIGAFLNEEAEFKNKPVWDSGIADRTGQSGVEVEVGTLTSVDIPVPGTPDQGPFGFSPRAVEISPDTTITWKWVDFPDLDIHHSVTSYNDSAAKPSDHGQVFNHVGKDGDTRKYTFDEVGTYLYFCHPHGTPYKLDLGPPSEKYLTSSACAVRSRSRTSSPTPSQPTIHETEQTNSTTSTGIEPHGQQG